MTKNIPLLQARGVQYSVESRSSNILDLKKLEVEAGSCLLILGENGAGKSSLLSVLGGELVPNSATLLWKGEPIKPLRERLVPGFAGISLVKQEPSLDSFLRVDDMITKALRHLSEQESRRKKAEVIHLCHLKKMLSHKTGSLSGGEKRRLAIALAIAMKSELLLLDEPFSDLDYESQEIIQAILHRLKTENGIGVVLVSHQGREVQWLADTVVTLARGRILEQLSKSSDGFRPTYETTARLLGWKNLIPAGLLPPELLKIGSRDGDSAYVTPDSLDFEPHHGWVYLGEGLILGALRSESEWTAKIQYVGRILEVQTGDMPDFTKMPVYLNPDKVLWFKK